MNAMNMNHRPTSWIKWRIATFWLLPLLLLTGCASHFDYGFKKPFEFGPTKADLSSYEKGTFRADYDRMVKTNNLVGARIERDRILQQLMYYITASHGQFTRNTTATKEWIDVGSDFAILGLAGAGTIVGGEEVKAILAAITTGVQGAQMTVNKRVFREQAIEALQLQMRAAMMRRKAEILDRMKQGVDVYSLDLGLNDIVEYYYDGTFTRAFQNLVSGAKKQEESANQDISDTIKTPASQPQIDDMKFITGQIKEIRTAADKTKALDRAKKIFKALKIEATEVDSLDKAVEKMGDLQDDLLKPENRDQIPMVRKLFETIK